MPLFGRRRLKEEKSISYPYSSSNIVKVIKYRKLRLADHAARLEEGRSAFKMLTGKPTGLGKDVRTILQCILEMCVNTRTLVKAT